MKPLQLTLAAALLIVGLACSGSTTSSMPTTTTPPPFATTVTDLVRNHTNETESPASLDSLNLSGSDVEDPHQFDPLLGIH